MTYRNEVLPHTERGRAKIFCPFIVAVVLVGLVLVAIVPLRYRAHLLWQYQAWRLELQGIEAIPNQPLPEIPIPADWVRCRVGNIGITLPPELVPNRTAAAAETAFHDHSRAIVVAVPEDYGLFEGVFVAAAELSGQPQPLTAPRLRLACYAASTDDFRWSMTANEVRWHAFRITHRTLIELIPGGHTESFRRGSVEGVVHFGDRRAIFEWQCNDSHLGGYMHFTHRGEDIDPAWIRAVCRSIELLGAGEETP